MSYPVINIPYLADRSSSLEFASPHPATVRQVTVRQKRAAQSSVTIAPEVASLVEAILDRYPLASPTLLQFVASEWNPGLDLICKQAAIELARRNVGDILLIDGNSNGNLTREEGQFGFPGVTDLANEELNWKRLVSPHPEPGLDFLPLGGGKWSQWGGLDRLRQCVAELKNRYQFVCLSSGQVQDTSSRCWSGISDGSFLVVSQTHSNSSIARSAVNELQTRGARLLGCIVTDAH